METPEVVSVKPEIHAEITPEQPRPAEIARSVYHVQLAAYRTKQRAEMGWRQLVLKAPDVLDGFDHVIVTPDPKFNAGGLLRLRSEACGSRADAKSLCDELKRRDMSCIIVQSKLGPGGPEPLSRADFAALRAAQQRQSGSDALPLTAQPQIFSGIDQGRETGLLVSRWDPGSQPDDIDAFPG
jgi:hypothetical protein